MSGLIRTLFYPPWLYGVSQILLGCTFIWAGGVKLISPRAFARTISGWDLLPNDFLIPVAIGLPVIELLAGLGLVFSIRGSLTVITGLLLAFLALLGRGILDNLNIDCGCFSPDDLHSHKNLVIAFYRDLGLMGVVGYLFMWRWFQRRSGTEREIRT